MSEDVSKLKRKIREQKDRIETLESELRKVEDDRQRFRDYWSQKMKWFIELHGQGKYPAMGSLVEDMAKFFNRVDRFYWN